MPAAHDATGSPSAHAAPETPLVSVIMIFLDAQRFIVEAIDSVLAQTYPAWELILVDDGSSDDSTRIARGHAELRPGQVRYVEHEGHRNLGMSASRNAGIAASRGELIAFLDSDDVYRPEKHERQVAILRSRPRAAMVYGASQYWHSPTGEAADAVLDRPRRLGVTPDTLVEPPSLVPASASSLGSHGAGADGEICDVGRPRVGGIDVEHRTLGPVSYTHLTLPTIYSV